MQFGVTLSVVLQLVCMYGKTIRTSTISISSTRSCQDSRSAALRVALPVELLLHADTWLVTLPPFEPIPCSPYLSWHSCSSACSKIFSKGKAWSRIVCPQPFPPRKQSITNTNRAFPCSPRLTVVYK